MTAVIFKCESDKNPPCPKTKPYLCNPAAVEHIPFFPARDAGSLGLKAGFTSFYLGRLLFGEHLELAPFDLNSQ